jgi:hypothetical protein
MFGENENKRALLVSSDEGWEGLWIDKKLIAQRHHLEEGTDRGLYFIALAEKYNLKLSDFQEAYANEKGEEYLESGGFPDSYEEIIGMVDFFEIKTAEQIL